MARHLERLAFIDQTSVKSTDRLRRQRLYDRAPFGDWRMQTFIAALRHDRLDAPGVIVFRHAKLTPKGGVSASNFKALLRSVGRFVGRQRTEGEMKRGGYDRAGAPRYGVDLGASVALILSTRKPRLSLRAGRKGFAALSVRDEEIAALRSGRIRD